MTAADAHELPPASGALVLTSEEVAAIERDGETVILTRDGRPVAKVHAIDPDQAWFWTPEWQAARNADQAHQTAAEFTERGFAASPARLDVAHPALGA